MGNVPGQVYHILPQLSWETAKRVGSYYPESLDNEGFIHCSDQSQVLKSANKFFPGQGGLLVLVIEINKLVVPLKWEESLESPGEFFPHIYGALNLDAVQKVMGIQEIDGRYHFIEPGNNDPFQSV